MKKIIIISGPTASGKTETSLYLTKCLMEKNIPASIVNFDSLLFYKEINIGTAKPDHKLRKTIEHHLIDIATIKNPLDASDFIQRATPIIKNLHKQGKTVILTGGSGFYLRALFKGMYPALDKEKIKKKLSTLYRQEGIVPIRKILKKNDPISFQTIHPNDHYRIIRAVEYYLSSGDVISKIKKEMNEYLPYDLHKNIHTQWDFYHCHLDIPKEEHFKIIKRRTQKMIEKGLIEEVASLLKKGFSGKERPLQSIGYKQVLDYLRGNLDFNKLMETINFKTRQLAKAQRTFFKKIPHKHIYHGVEDREKIIVKTLHFMESSLN